MKKNLRGRVMLTLTVAGVMIALTGCGSPEVITEPVENVNDALEEAEVGMANPMVSVSSDSEFMDKLGIALDTSCINGENIERYIISDEIAHVAFNVSDPEGNSVKCILRGTKNDELAKNPTELIAGVYASDFAEPNEVLVPSEKGDISFNTVYSESENDTVSYWDYDGVHYTFSVDGNISQMLISELNDSALRAIGVTISEPSGKYIAPLEESVDINNIDDAMFNASISNIATADGITTADVTLYTMDLYDVVDITTMTPGDTIFVNGEEIVVSTIDEGNPVDFNDGQGQRNVILVNGGIEEGGTELIGYEGGTYRFFGFDDHASYTEKGTVNMEIASDAIINDTSDLDNPDGVTIAASELVNLKDKEFDPGFNLLNTRIRVVDNKVVEIERKYIP